MTLHPTLQPFHKTARLDYGRTLPITRRHKRLNGSDHGSVGFFLREEFYCVCTVPYFKNLFSCAKWFHSVVSRRVNSTHLLRKAELRRSSTQYPKRSKTARNLSPWSAATPDSIQAQYTTNTCMGSHRWRQSRHRTYSNAYMVCRNSWFHPSSPNFQHMYL